MGWLKLLGRKWNSFWRLERSDRTLLLQALVLLPVVAISLKLWGLQQTQTVLAQLLPVREIPIQSSNQIPQVWTTTRMVRTAARYNGVWANCLKKSLVLWWLLRRQGISSELRIGVQRLEGKFSAHAWVECDGVVLNDRPDVRQQFAMFERPIQVNLPAIIPNPPPLPESHHTIEAAPLNYPVD